MVSSESDFSKPCDNALLDVAPNISEEDYQELFRLDNRPVYSGVIQVNPLSRWENQGNIAFPLEIEAHKVVMQHPVITGIVTEIQTIRVKYNRYYVRERFGRAPPTTQTESSWRKMFLTQPPMTTITLDLPLYVATFKPGEAVRVRVDAQSGVTLGMVKNELEKAMEKFRIKDCRHLAQRRKKKLGKQEYVKVGESTNSSSTSPSLRRIHDRITRIHCRSLCWRAFEESLPQVAEDKVAAIW